MATPEDLIDSEANKHLTRVVDLFQMLENLRQPPHTEERIKAMSVVVSELMDLVPAGNSGVTIHAAITLNIGVKTMYLQYSVAFDFQLPPIPGLEGPTDKVQ